MQNRWGQHCCRSPRVAELDVDDTSIVDARRRQTFRKPAHAMTPAPSDSKPTSGEELSSRSRRQMAHGPERPCTMSWASLHTEYSQAFSSKRLRADRGARQPMPALRKHLAQQCARVSGGRSRLSRSQIRGYVSSEDPQGPVGVLGTPRGRSQVPRPSGPSLSKSATCNRLEIRKVQSGPGGRQRSRSQVPGLRGAPSLRSRGSLRVPGPGGDPRVRTQVLGIPQGPLGPRSGSFRVLSQGLGDPQGPLPGPGGPSGSPSGVPKAHPEAPNRSRLRRTRGGV